MTDPSFEETPATMVLPDPEDMTLEVAEEHYGWLLGEAQWHGAAELFGVEETDDRLTMVTKMWAGYEVVATRVYRICVAYRRQALASSTPTYTTYALHLLRRGNVWTVVTVFDESGVPVNPAGRSSQETNMSSVKFADKSLAARMCAVACVVGSQPVFFDGFAALWESSIRQADKSVEDRISDPKRMTRRLREAHFLMHLSLPDPEDQAVLDGSRLLVALGDAGDHPFISEMGFIDEDPDAISTLTVGN